MTKTELAGSLQEAHPNVTKKQLTEIVEEMFTLIKQDVHTGGEFAFPGFGKFSKGRREERAGRNPQTGEALTIPAKNTVKFKAAKAFVDQLQ